MFLLVLAAGIEGRCRALLFSGMAVVVSAACRVVSSLAFPSR